MRFCKLILISCKTHQSLAILNDFLRLNNFEWKYCVGLFTGGGHAISGCFSGLRVSVHGVASNAKWTHCTIHRETLVLQQLSIDLNEVLQIVEKIVNFNKNKTF